ncbi:MAG: putative transport system permease protein, partial [Patescibacteria group bacterium]|nr:putative transport system permease protein [Patescibacteria group bacterium]
QGDVRQTNVRTSNIFTLDDTEEIRKIPGVSAVSPVANSSKQVIVGNANANTTVYGVGADYSEIKNIKAQYGLFIGADDVDDRSKVAVLGPTTATNFFGTKNPLGQDVKVGNVYLRVIGIAESKGSGSGPVSSTDDAIYVPITTMQDRFLGNKYVSQFVIMADSSEAMDATKQSVTDHFLMKFKIPDPAQANFQVSSSADMLATISSVTGTLKIFLAGIAAISLVVGGIGIMNIMLVSVSERTREIGIRRSIGALNRDIVVQFLTEAVVLTFLGGTIGVAFSFALVALASLFSLPAFITMSSVLLSFGCSVAIGIVFGLLPAYKAARLKPIDALRSE